MDDTKITFIDEDGTEVIFNVIETAKLGGKDYLLVCEDDEEAEDAYIMQMVKDENGELTYIFVDDDKELEVLSDYFNNLLDDVTLE